ncbi:hypothetical protein BKA70DRAFT_1371714 [Coprinopsis sp. MPI-PUGE-AT-0042]|nr:hypothetical protein BKA70DRAFT_1371714 [Coprinopsis sp. MPI-PUGE-AT-0042]
MSYINLIYLGILTERIPVIPTFAVTHGISTQEPRVRFSEVFDLPRLRKELRMPVIEWGDVKQNSSEEVDEIGCWSSWAGGAPIWTTIPHWLKLDISYTPAPRWINLNPAGTDVWGSFSAFAALTFPQQTKEFAGEPVPSAEQGLKLPPDQHMMCFDQTYYVGALAQFEFVHDYSPAWRFVGKHLHWNHRLEGIADQYVRKTLGVADGENTPTWITRFARNTASPLDRCYIPIVNVKKELLDKKGMVVDQVIMTSDEEDPNWYPVFIDAVVQSGGMGLVGTDKSTMSIIAQRRVEAWLDGATRLVEFPSSDY